MQHRVSSPQIFDLRGELNKVFGEHAHYTGELITENFPYLNSAASDATVNRLLRNPADIARIVSTAGASVSKGVADQFTKHLKLAAAILAPARDDENEEALNRAVAAFLANGDEVGAALSRINPQAIPVAAAQAAMREHNQYVLELISLRKAERYADYIAVYDDYRDHILTIADTIYNALAARPNM